ncbi:MAG: hypothetical protein QOH79_3882 [Acidimicrobiaceae bacterium]
MDRLGTVIAGLCTMGLAVGAAFLIGRIGDQPGAGFVVGLAVLVTGGFLAGLVLRPKPIEVCVVAAVLTVAAWVSWSPSGEAGPGERSMDWRAAGGVVLEGCIPVALWGLAALGAEHLRREHKTRA